MIDYTRLTMSRIDGLWSMLVIRSADELIPESLSKPVLTDAPTEGHTLTLGQVKALFHARAWNDVRICVRQAGGGHNWHLTKHKDTVVWREHLGREPLCFDDFATILANGVVWLSKEPESA